MMFSFIAVVVIIMIIVVSYLLKSKKKVKISPKVVAVSTIEQLQTDILTINIELRQTCYNKELLLLAESILDKVNLIFPKIEELNPTGDSVFTLKSLPQKYLFEKIMKPYQKLSKEDQLLKSDQTKEALSVLMSEVSEIEESMNQQDIKNLDLKLEFINRKFK